MALNLSYTITLAAEINIIIPLNVQVISSLQTIRIIFDLKILTVDQRRTCILKKLNNYWVIKADIQEIL